MRFAGLVLVLMTGVAGAQPITHPAMAEPCNVKIEVAPPEARAEIESWVRSEPRCTKTLEVRVVPTDDGLYLSARDQDGRMRERVVPDGESAAVLVVSWMADDSLGPAFPEPRAATDGAAAGTGDGAPTPVEIVRPHVRFVGGDDDESPFARPGLTGGHTRFKPASHRFLTLGAIGSSPERAGVRGQVDLLGGAHWLVGIAGGWGVNGGQARLVVGASYSFGRVSLRAQLGLGADYVVHPGDRDRDMMMMTASPTMEPADFDDAIRPHAEAGILARIAIDRNWGAIGGPILDVDLVDGDAAIEAFVGVQHGL